MQVAKMNTMHRPFLFVAAILMAGCASPHVWVKSGASQDDFSRDLARCRYESAAATAGYGTGRVSPTMGGALAQGFGEGMTIGLRQSELMTLCMQANGYTKKMVGSGQQAPPTVAPASSMTTHVADSSNADPETEKAIQTLKDSGFPLVGTPARFKTSGNRSYYEAWGSGGRLTHVICETGVCRMRTIYD